MTLRKFGGRRRVGCFDERMLPEVLKDFLTSLARDLGVVIRRQLPIPDTGMHWLQGQIQQCDRPSDIERRGSRELDRDLHRSSPSGGTSLTIIATGAEKGITSIQWNPTLFSYPGEGRSQKAGSVRDLVGFSQRNRLGRDGLLPSGFGRTECGNDLVGKRSLDLGTGFPQFLDF